MNQGQKAAAALARFIAGRTFKTILADPAWQFHNRTGKVAPEHRRLNRYGTRTIEHIRCLPVAAAADDTSHLYLWLPDVLLPERLAVMTA